MVAGLSRGREAAIDQAVLDQVDVINFSIGGASRNPWTDPNAIAFLGANAAGVFASVSAGNAGPGAATIGSPSDSPWVMSAGASTHDRNLPSQLTDMAGGAAAPPAAITDVFLSRVTGAARQLAVDAIDDASARGGNAGKIAEAEQAVAQGDALRDGGSYKSAVNKYKDAVAKAEGV